MTNYKLIHKLILTIPHANKFMAMFKTYFGGLICLWFWYIAAIFVFLPFFPFGIWLYLIRIIEGSVYKCFFGAEELKADESIWIYDSPKNLSIINAVIEFDGYLSVSELQSAVVQRLVGATDKDGNLMYSRVTKRIHAAPFNYYLVEEDKFNIEDHVYAWNKGKNYSTNELTDILTMVSSRKFPSHLSPWEYVVIHIKGDVAVKTTAVVFRIHNCLADGIALTDFLIRQLPDKSVSLPNLRRMTKRDKQYLTLKGMFFSPLVLLRMVFKKVQRTPVHSNKCLSGRKLYAWSKPLDLDLVKDIRRRLGVTVNDIIVGCVAKAFGAYFMERFPSQSARDVLCSIPVDTRINWKEARTFSNKAAFVQIVLPSSLVDSMEAVFESKRHMDSIKATGDAFASRMHMKIFGYLLPARWFNRLVLKFSNKAPVTVANIAGPQSPVSVAGQEIKFLSFFPPHRGNTTMGVSVFSYAGRYVIGVEADETVISEPSKICSNFAAAVHELAKTTGVFMTKVHGDQRLT